MARTIPLTQGLFALVDEEDFGRLSQFGWYSAKRGRVTYAARPRPGKPGSVIYMHRDILDVGPRLRLDHINHDGLDNRRENLRPATGSLNAANARLQSNNRCGFRGVRRHQCGSWVAQIKVQGKKFHLGSFQCVICAAKAYDRAAKDAFGEFAYSNIASLNPDNCAGYGSHTCHRCTVAAREVEPA